MEGKLIFYRNVSFSYERGVVVLDNIDLEVGPGLTLLLGPNGCGKSTFLRLTAGIEMPDSGTIVISGADLMRDEVEARRQLVYLPEFPDLSPYATIREIMDMVCRLRGEPVAEGENALKKTELQNLTNRTVRELSNGQRRRAVFAACLIGTPGLLLLDEPLEGMDMHMKELIFSWIGDHIKKASTILLATHTIQPFISIASGAIRFKECRSVHYQDLPEEQEKKKTLLEDAARNISSDTLLFRETENLKP